MFCAPVGMKFIAMVTAAKDGGLARDDVVKRVKVDVNMAKAAPCGSQATSLGVQPDYSSAHLFVPHRDGDRGAFVNVDAVQPTRRSFDASRIALYGKGPFALELTNGTLCASRDRITIESPELPEPDPLPAPTPPVTQPVSQAFRFFGSSSVSDDQIIFRQSNQHARFRRDDCRFFTESVTLFILYSGHRSKELSSAADYHI